MELLLYHGDIGQTLKKIAVTLAQMDSELNVPAGKQLDAADCGPIDKILDK